MQEANGHVETARYIGFGLGPVLGALLFAAGGLELAMLVDAATFAAVAVAALALRVRRPPAGADDAETRRAPATGSPTCSPTGRWRWRWRRVRLAAVHVRGLGRASCSSSRTCSAAATSPTAPSSRCGPSGWRWARCCSRPGSPPARSPPPACWPPPSRGLGLALPALWLSFGFFLACSFVGGAAHGVKNVMFRSLIHVRVPDHLHGRAFAAYNGIRNAAELGAFAAGGVLVAAIGARGTVAYAGALSALVGADRPAGAGAPLSRLGADRARSG